LRGWVKKHQKQHESSADADLTVSERARLKELERRIREVEMENVFLKKWLSCRIRGSLTWVYAQNTPYPEYVSTA
ncbi:hypothetical protein ABZX39_39820, partial [Streptomyces collinus]|uniref:transposase n=1 Tax=Streptomyces collinus TaxID=42684 RepID=UPI00346F90D5